MFVIWGIATAWRSRNDRYFLLRGEKHKKHTGFPGVLFINYLTYSMTTLRLGSVPVEWVVMLSISCRAEWIT